MKASILYSTILFGIAAQSFAQQQPPVVSQSTATPPAITLKTAPDKYLAFDDVRLRYKDIGQGEPIVLLHGYSDNLEMTWRGVADSLAKTNRVIALDERGFGKSSKFSDLAHYKTGLFTDVIRLLDSLGIAKAHIIGHSMGGLVAANVALRYPKRVGTLILVAGELHPDAASINKDYPTIGTDLQQGRGFTGLIAHLYPQLDSNTVKAINKDIMSRNDVGALLAVGQAMPLWLISPKRAARATMPALLLAGSNDPASPLSRQMADWWPGARFVEIKGADHDNVVRKPDFLTEVRKALRTRPISSR
jgi:pimeloyl-ACP methyl ester carboxylesterase